MKIIFFDLESNGFEGSSVLSLSALKFQFNTDSTEFIELDKFNRYYFRNPNETYNNKAVEINGLKDSVIALYRSNIDYPLIFNKDINSFKLFCNDVNHFIAHNIAFDSSFIPFKLKYQFCTMKSNVNILKLNWNDKYKSYKWPTLEETVNFYKIEINKSKLHQSIYDTYLTFMIFKSMLNKKQILKEINSFFNKK